MPKKRAGRRKGRYRILKLDTLRQMHYRGPESEESLTAFGRRVTDFDINCRPRFCCYQESPDGLWVRSNGKTTLQLPGWVLDLPPLFSNPEQGLMADQKWRNVGVADVM